MTLTTSAAGGLEPLERPQVDLRMHLPERPAVPGAVLNKIDPRSVHEVSRWPRSLHALLLDRLTAAGACHVYFDIDFSLRCGESEAPVAALEGPLERGRRETWLVDFPHRGEPAR